MTENVYLKIAQDKGLIDQDDYQGWRLTAKGEGFLSLILDDERRIRYDYDSRRLSRQLNDGLRGWQVTQWHHACRDGHPDRIKVEALGLVPFVYWIDAEQLEGRDYDIGLIIAGQYEAALREAIGT